MRAVRIGLVWLGWLVFPLMGCAHVKQDTSMSQADLVARELAASNVASMATGLASDPQVDRIWTTYPSPATYALLVEDAHRPEPVRFAAALVLRSRSAEQFEKANPGQMAQVFAGALQHDLARTAWPWGRLWGSDDELGLLGRNFLTLGTAAIPALAALLDDATPRDKYPGSDEATLMKVRHYRVKDFAAFYLSRIAHLDLPWEPNLAKRDEAIARLRQQLPR